MKDLKYLVDALVREEINVDGVVAADRLTRQNSEADSLLAGVLVQEVQIRWGPYEDDHVRDFEDATRGLTVKFNLKKKTVNDFRKNWFIRTSLFTKENWSWFDNSAGFVIIKFDSGVIFSYSGVQRKI